jgi:hypothetical protein
VLWFLAAIRLSAGASGIGVLIVAQLEIKITKKRLRERIKLDIDSVSLILKRLTIPLSE